MVQTQTQQHWYAAKAKPSQEHIALRDLQAQKFQTYYPLIEIEKIGKAGKVVKCTEGLFPGYLFVFCHMEASSWRAINGTRGVLRLISFHPDGKPSYIPNCEVEAIKEAENKGQFKYSTIKRFRKGDLIKVKNGISVGLQGKVLRTKGERVEFLMRLLNRTVRCSAPYHTLDLVLPAPVRKPLPA